MYLERPSPFLPGPTEHSNCFIRCRCIGYLASKCAATAIELFFSFALLLFPCCFLIVPLHAFLNACVLYHVSRLFCAADLCASFYCCGGHSVFRVLALLCLPLSPTGYSPLRLHCVWIQYVNKVSGSVGQKVRYRTFWPVAPVCLVKNVFNIYCKDGGQG